MPRSYRFLPTLAVAAALVLLPACGGTAAQSTATTAVSPAAAVVKIGYTWLGPVVVDARGFTLYEWDYEAAGQSLCNKGCDSIWPPLTIKGFEVPVGPGLNRSRFLTIQRDDRSRVVVFNGRTLYRSIYDKKPGDLSGIRAGRGAWHPMSPNGKKIVKP
ncbi:MAG: hypothetical protein QOH10_485 [Actinomycetota bacterium]|nr:hypothetical protein [Actinomycetota bacterium]